MPVAPFLAGSSVVP